MSFSFSSGQGYDLFGNTANISPPDTVGPLGPFTGADDDNDFELGEDVTGNGNEYQGTILIDGISYPVVTGEDGMGGPQADFLLIIVPDGEVTPTFPASFDVFPEVSQSTFFYCFAANTKIETSDGEVAVENLTRDHFVRTKDNEFVPVRWVGCQTFSTRFGAGRRAGLIKFAAGSLGDGLPHSDLMVTADHAMYIDGMLVQAAALVNGSSIEHVPAGTLPSQVTVYHLETQTHNVIFANGVGAETFLDVVNRSQYDNYQDYLDTVGPERVIPEMDAPRVNSGRLLPREIKDRLGIPADHTQERVA